VTEGADFKLPREAHSYSHTEFYSALHCGRVRSRCAIDPERADRKIGDPVQSRPESIEALAEANTTTAGLTQKPTALVITMKEAPARPRSSTGFFSTSQ